MSALRDTKYLRPEQARQELGTRLAWLLAGVLVTVPIVWVWAYGTGRRDAAIGPELQRRAAIEACTADQVPAIAVRSGAVLCLAGSGRAGAR